jgi:transposase
VLDAFHAVRLAQQAIDDVRRRVQQDTRGHRGRTGDPLYGIRRVLQRGAEHLSPTAYGRLLAGLDVGDPRGEVAAAYIAGQELRHLYAAPDTDRARRRLHTFYQACAAPGVPELERLGRTISAWEEQLFACFRTGGASNGPTEAVNLLVKRIKRAGFGFRNFANYSACCCTAASAGTLIDRHGFEAGHHVLWRRAVKWQRLTWLRRGMSCSPRTKALQSSDVSSARPLCVTPITTAG